MIEIVPTIFTADLEEFSRKVALAKEVVERIQIDVVDGKFAFPRTVDLAGVKQLLDSGLLPSSLRLDLHLMVGRPEDWVKRCLEVLPERIIGQVEMMTDAKAFVTQVVDSGVQAGIALDLETPVESIGEDLYHLADLVLVMSVKAGAGGQKFDKRALTKIVQIKKIVGDLVKIGVDGGLNEESISLCRTAGAEIFYVGNSFWEAADLLERYQELTKIAV
ncbi:MAG: ribulose-phosphate 3-epimerase [Microgenomates group bacterium]